MTQMYALYSSPSSYTPSFRSDVASLSGMTAEPWNCEGAGSSDYWRVTSTLNTHIKTALTDGLKMEILCSCSYQVFGSADLFCKPAGGFAALGKAADATLARELPSPFSCPMLDG